MIVEFQILLTQTVLHKDCVQALHIQQYFLFLLISPLAVIGFASSKLAPFPKDLQDLVVGGIAQLRCGAPGSTKLIMDQWLSYEVALFATAAVLSFVSLCMAGVIYWKWTHPVVMQTGSMVLFAGLVGSSFNYWTVLLWIGFPTQV